MKRQYRMTSVFVSCMLILVGCNAEPTNTVVEKQEAQTFVEEVQTTVSTEVPETEVTTESEKMEMIQTAPQLRIERKTNEIFDDAGTLLISAVYENLSVEDNGFELLAEAIRKWSEENESAILEEVNEAASWAVEAPSSSEYSIEESIEVIRADERVISFTQSNYSYLGGAHGNYGTRGYTFDAQTGKQLEIADLLADKEGFIAAANEYLFTELEKEYSEGLLPDYQETIQAMWEQNPNWYLTGSGIMILFNPYEIGPYAMGDAKVLLPFETFGSYIKEEYKEAYAVGVTKLEKDKAIVLPGEDEHTVMIQEEVVGDYDDASVILSTDTDSATEGPWSFLMDAYLINREDGRSFVLFYTNFASDDYVMYVYEVTGGKLEKTDEVNALYFGDGVVNTQIIELSRNLDVLGTYCTCMDYALDENGKLVAQEEMYEIPAISYEWHKLTTTKDLPVQINGEERVLPIGTKLRITATDNAGKAWFRVLDSGEEGVINYTKGNGEDTWGCYIDGIRDMEYFEMVPYAG